MAEYYYLKNIETNEIDYLQSWEFTTAFGGKFEHMLCLCSVDFYVEKGIDISKDKEEKIFFMNFVENWNKYNKAFLSNYEAIYFSDLSQEEQNKILTKQKALEEHCTSSSQNNKEVKINFDYVTDEKIKKKKAGNGLSKPYFSETLQKWIWQYWFKGKRKTLTQRKGERKTDFFTRVRAIQNKLDNGSYIEKRTDTVHEIIEKHIEQKFKDGITIGTSYRRDKDTLISIDKSCDNFVNKPIQKVTLDDIQEAKEIIKTYAQSVIDKIWRLLFKAFSIASSKSVNLIPYNIMDDENLKKPISIKDTKKIKPLTKAERECLEHVLDYEEKDHKYRNIVKLEWITSMRISEVLARSKEDINKEFSKLHIHNTLTRDKDGKTILGEHTKTYNKNTGIDEGERYFPITTEIKKILDEQLSGKITNIYGLLFWDYENNTFICDKEINAWLRRINNKYKICKGSLHNHRLRHDRITDWKESGIDMKAIQYFAGHVEESDITDKVYIDISPEYAFEEYKKII